jgi:tetratricopeptide (TPR) repeat protein
MSLHSLRTFVSVASVIAVAAFCAAEWTASAQENPPAPPAPAPGLPSQEQLPGLPGLPGHEQMAPNQEQTESDGPAPRKPHRITRQSKAAFLATLYDQLEKAPSEEAAEVVAKAIERVWRQSGSDTADLLMERAGVAIQAKNFELALQVLSALVEIAPGYAEGWNQLATVYFLQEDYDKAMRGLRHVLSLEPRHYKAIEGLALILREMGDKKGALRATRRALSVYPHLKSAQQAEEELKRDVEGQGI